MIRRISLWYANLKLKNKISLLASAVLLAISITMYLFASIFFLSLFKHENQQISQNWIESKTNYFDEMWEDIYYVITDSIVKPDFVSAMYNSLYNDDDSIFTQVQVHPYVEDIGKANAIISSAYILNKNGSCFKKYDDIPYSSEEYLLKYDNLKHIRSISLLPEMKSPFSRMEMVVPVAVPFSFINDMPYLGIEYNEEPDIIIVLLFSRDRLLSFLNRANSQYFDLEVNLAVDGKLVTPMQNSWNNRLTMTNQTTLEGVDLVMDIDESHYMLLKSAIMGVTFLITLTFLSIGLLCIRRIARKLTKPFDQMTGMIDQISKGTYDLSCSACYKDETGTLITGINNMYLTLIGQMNKIKEEEKQKYLLQSQMLTEQINPHFIYNTLELINMEITMDNKDSASLMIQDFASFLRHGLNKGELITTLENEIEHVKAYSNIMNCRLNMNIDFSFNCEDDLLDTRIPKIIFQPLVENSIKYGFSNGQENTDIYLPAISIDISRTDDGHIAISVTDNGTGFDTEEMYRKLKDAGGKNGIGLANIRKRLCLYFSFVEFQFESIPYYQNKVSILLDDSLVS